MPAMKEADYLVLLFARTIADELLKLNPRAHVDYHAYVPMAQALVGKLFEHAEKHKGMAPPIING